MLESLIQKTRESHNLRNPVCGPAHVNELTCKVLEVSVV